MNSSLPAEIPQNSMAHQQRLQNIGASVWQISHTLNVFMLEDKIPNPGKLLFRFSLGSYVMDQRSGDGRFGGRF